MRARCLVLALIALPLFLAAENPPSEYASLLAALKAGNTNIDYGRLRLSYVDSPESAQTKDTSAPEKAMTQALGAKDFPTALKDAEIVLASNYVNIDAHFVAFIANQEMGVPEKAKFHQAVFCGLIDSICDSGDGESTEKAWVVIDVHEEYVVLRPWVQAVRAEPGEQGRTFIRCDEGEEHERSNGRDVLLQGGYSFQALRHLNGRAAFRIRREGDDRR